MLDNKRIIFVHGLASKPSKDQTHNLWKKSLVESLNVSSDIFEGLSENEIDNVFESAYWANAVPSHIEDDSNYVNKLGTCVNNTILERKEKAEGFHVGLGAKFKSFFKSRAIDVVDIFSSALTIKDNIAEGFLREVNHYTNDQYIADRMRAPLEKALRDAWDEGKEVCVISHSMGTFISYDVLWRFSHRSTDNYRQYKDKKVDYFVTMGSPLGDSSIQNLLFAKRYKDEKKRAYPNNITKWHNFSCLGDVVAHDSTLNDDFMKEMKKLNLIADDNTRDYIKLYNPFVTPSGKKNPHKSYGYLVQPKLAEHIKRFCES
jgi:hypothetical protein